MKTADFFKIKDSFVTRLNRAADNLGKALRENVIVYEFNKDQSTVVFLSETNHFYKANFKHNEDGLAFTNFSIAKAGDVLSDESIDSFLNEQTLSLVDNLGKSDFDSSRVYWTNIISVLEQRQNVSKLKKNIELKVKNLSSCRVVLESDQYKKFLEQKDTTVKFLTENKDKVQDIDEVINSLRLLKSIVNVFDNKAITRDSLISEGFTVAPNREESLYELICKRELVAKEILESKRKFGKLWASDPCFAELASLVKESDEEVVFGKLYDTVVRIPYFALASKTDLNDAFGLTFMLEGYQDISEKDKNSFVSLVFELKKPIKEAVLSELNEKYGININALDIKPNLTNVAKINNVLLESLAQLIPSPTTKDTLKEFTVFLKDKNGIESLEIASKLLEMFNESKVETTEVLSEPILVEQLDIDAIMENYYPDDDNISKTGKNTEKDSKGPKKDAKKKNLFGKGKEDEKGGKKPFEKGDEGEGEEDEGDEDDKPNDEEKPKKKKGFFGKKSKGGKTSPDTDKDGSPSAKAIAGTVSEEEDEESGEEQADFEDEDSPQLSLSRDEIKDLITTLEDSLK